MLLTKEKLLQRQELQLVKVNLGNGDHVFVREMTARERDEYEISLLPDEEGQERDMSDFRARLAVRCLCNDKGNLILSVKDAQTLSNNMGAARMRLIAEAAGKLNKLPIEDQKEIEKNSTAAQSGNSISGSVEN
jgi:hypothetical protein